MKVKRFNNLWAMGLILFGAILVAFYVIKIFFPQFIIEIAEVPQIVEFGNLIQSNKWYLHIFNFVSAYIDGYIIFCACCRVPKLNLKSNLVFIGCLTILRLVSEFYPQQYATINYIFLVLIPFLMCLCNNNINGKTFISTITCFSLDLGFQIFSIFVRNLPVMATQPNIATVLILLIDVFIWRVMLYLYFNYKEAK